MTTNEIRSKFLEFFRSKGHSVIASDSVVPKEDPTVLFTTAGMQQFKRQFLGEIEGYTRAATSQKCLRTDDLDKIGKTPCHHTFFEMLGNFSFGDYFKKEAIVWAWEFLTKVMKISTDKLWASVYTDDEEAEQIWMNMVKLPKEKLVRLGDKDNFWPAEAKEKGPNGPCGPCSEIFFDYGVNPNCKNPKCDPSCSCGRFTEIWNLVFTQFNRKDGGVLEPLPGKNIDTGMGLERLASVVQGKKNNFEIDLFEPIFQTIDSEFKKQNVSLEERERKILVDHIRAVVFGISDGVVPSNEGRGYVIKKLIVDITDIAIRSGIKDPIIHKLVSPVVMAMKDPYPEISVKQNEIAAIIQKVEESYIKTRTERIPELTNIFQNANAETLSKMGETIFKFRDTYGLPLPTIVDTLQSGGIRQEAIDQGLKDYSRLMDDQKNRSRASSKMTGERFADTELNLNVPKTKFLGYDQFSAPAKVLKVFVENTEVSQATAGQIVKILLDQTPFYAESGGQVGDTGTIQGSMGTVQISDTQKISDVFIHSGTVQTGSLKNGESIEAKIDADRRQAIMRNHTATHLLQAALRKVLGAHVQQQGSLVAEDRLRFDFTHPQAVSKDQQQKIESIIEQEIQANDTVVKKEMALKEAKDTGAMAFFAEKYRDVVRVISVGDYSKELCGGTHLNSTGEIGAFKITAEGAVAQGIRRIEARTGSGAQEFMEEQQKQTAERLASEQKRREDLERKKENDRKVLEAFKNSLENILKGAETVHNTHIVIYQAQDSDANQLKQMFDLLKQQVGSIAVCLAATLEGGAAIVVGVSDDLVKRGIRANELIKEIAPLMGGSGGGRPELAQAGSKSPDKLAAALEHAKKILTQKIAQ